MPDIQNGEAEMIIPTNGRVVVVDDKIEEEAIPLIVALSRIGVPVRFYTGELDTLPEEPLNGIRILFLDIKLKGLEMFNNTDDLVNALRPVIERIVDKNNGPYVLIGWTKEPQHLKKLSEVLDPPPMLWLDMEKSSCMYDRKCDITKILPLLEKHMRKLDAFRLLFSWENMANDSAYQTVNALTSHCASADDPNSALTELLWKLAKATLGKNIQDKSSAEILASAMMAFNGPFTDTLETNVQNSANYDKVLEGISELSDAIIKDSPEVDASINAKLHLAEPANNDVVPGNLYNVWDDLSLSSLKSMIFQSIDPRCLLDSFLQKKKAEGVKAQDADGRLLKTFKTEFDEVNKNHRAEIVKLTTLYVLEVSPYCDYAQKKGIFHRLVPCVAWPSEYNNLLKRQADYLYITPVFIHNKLRESSFCFVCDFRLFTSVSQETMDKRSPVCRLKQELIVDIQSRLSRHVSRPGIISIS